VNSSKKPFCIRSKFSVISFAASIQETLQTLCRQSSLIAEILRSSESYGDLFTSEAISLGPMESLTHCRRKDPIEPTMGCAYLFCFHPG